MRAAKTSRHFDLRIYNFLAHRDYRQYRLQFARTFPGLLLTAVVAEPRSLGEELHSIVDSGDLSIQCMRDVKGLALALNALHPQDLPGESRAEWDEFNRIVATGHRLILGPICEPPAGLEWLGECVRRAKRQDTRALELWLSRPWSWTRLTARFCASFPRRP